MSKLRFVAFFSLSALVSPPSTSHAQFWARLLNPEVSVEMRHPPDFGLEVETVVFGPASGECSDEIVQSLVGALVTDGIEVVNRQEADLILAEHQLAAGGWVNPESAAAIGELFGPSLMIGVNVTRCAVEQSPSYRDHIRERTDPDTDEKYEVVEREFFSKTAAHLRAAVQVTDMATGKIVGVIGSDHAPERVNRSYEGQPEFPAVYEVLDIGYAGVNQDVLRRLLGWTETRKLVFYDDDDCGLKAAHRALASGMPERALELSVGNLETCTSTPGVEANKLARAYYNVGMSHVILGEQEQGLAYLRAARKLDDGGIVRDAIEGAETALRLREEMRNFQADTERELVNRQTAREREAAAAAANLVTNEDVIAMVRQGLSDAIVVRKIETSPCRFDTSADGLVALTDAGVPETVVLAMIDARCDED